MAYGNKSNVNVEENVIYSLEPGIYEGGRIAEVKKELAGKEDGDKKPVLVFMFESADGKKHQHTEWEQEDETKINNQLGRVGSYIRQINPEYQFPGVDSWEGFRDHVISEMLNSKNVKVDFKVVANVYNAAKPRTQLPNYKGAVVASSKGATPKFSPSELADISVYKKILAGEYNPTGDIGGGDIPVDDILGGNPEDIL